MTKVDTEFAGFGLADRITYRICRDTLVGICRTYCRMSVTGKEHVPPSGAFVIAPVHRSYVDTPISSVVTRRRIRYMGKDSLWRKQPWRWLLTAVGGFPVSRGSSDREALERCLTVLDRGEPLLLFPEGERKDGPIVQPLMRGAAYVAVKRGVPVIPVGIGGSDKVMPRGKKFIYPKKVHVVIGAPIMPPPSSGKGLKADVNELNALLHAELQRLYDAAQARCR